MKIVVRNVSYKYGRKKALDNISLDIGPGVTGLIGVNGSGKTTLLKLILGIIPIQEGEILINDSPVPIKDKEKLVEIGYIPEIPALDNELTLHEYLGFFLSILETAGGKTTGLDEIIEIVGLGDAKNRRISDYSRGMKQRACISQSILCKRRILILDEPLSHLDPLSRIQFKELFRECADDGAIVLISSHILGELDEICDNVVILNDGKLIEYGAIGQLRNKYESNVVQWVIETDSPIELADLIENELNPSAIEVIGNVIRVLVGSNPRMKSLFFGLLARTCNIEIFRFYDRSLSLEGILKRSMGDNKNESQIH